MFNQHIQECGKPEKIISDHGTQFTSEVWKNKLKVKGIQPVLKTINK